MDGELGRRVEQARKGQRAAVEWLLASEQQRIFAIAYHMLGRSDEAEEAAQEALIRIFTRLDQLREAGQFRAWSARIAANLCRDRLRSRNGRCQSLELAGELPSGGDPQDRAAHPEMRAKLAWALAQLSPVLRLPVLLRDVEGMAYEEVAAALNVPLGTVKSRLHEARRKLRGWLARQGVLSHDL